MLFRSLGHNWSLVKNVSFCPRLRAAPQLPCTVRGEGWRMQPEALLWLMPLGFLLGIDPSSPPWHHCVAGQTAQGCHHHHAPPGCPNWQMYLRGQRSAMHLRGTAAVQDVSATARVIQGLALVSLCKAKTKPRTISPKPVLLPFSVCTCHPAQQYL